MVSAPVWPPSRDVRSLPAAVPRAARSSLSKGPVMLGIPGPAHRSRVEDDSKLPTRAGGGTKRGKDPQKPDQRLGRSRRLTRRNDFQQAYAQGHKHVGRLMVLWTRTGEDAALRLGVVAGRKVGNAIARARAKRLLREAYRRNRVFLTGHVDVVIVARRSILSAAWDDIVKELLSLAGRAGIRAEKES